MARKKTSPIEAMVNNTTQYGLAESTRVFIEKLASDWVAKDMADPVYRQRMQELVARAYAEAKARLEAGRD